MRTVIFLMFVVGCGDKEEGEPPPSTNPTTTTTSTQTTVPTTTTPTGTEPTTPTTVTTTDTGTPPTDTGPTTSTPTTTSVLDTALTCSDPTDTGNIPSTITTAGLPFGGYGTITGSCGDIDVTVSGTQLFASTFDFGPGPHVDGYWSDPAEELICDGNLGGSSVESEALSMEMLYRCEAAQLVRTEAEIQYSDPGGKKTDILVKMQGDNIGVSVVRSLTYDFNTGGKCGTVVQADKDELIESKLDDILLSHANAVNPWERSMLAVIACDQAHADAAITAYNNASAQTKSNTLLWVITSDGEDAFIYE